MTNQIAVFKSVEQNRKAIPGANLPASVVTVSMFIVSGDPLTYIGYVYPEGHEREGSFAPYHSGSRKYIRRVWKEKYAK